MKKLLLQVSLLSFLVFLFAETALCQENQTIVNQFSLPEENWLLVVSATKHQLHFTFDKKEYVQDGTIIRLHRIKKKFEDANENKQILMWENFFPSSDGGRQQHWIADVYLDATTKKSYLALSDSSFFWAKIIDWDGVVRRVPDNMNGVKMELPLRIKKQDAEKLLRPFSSDYDEFHTDNIKVDYVEQEIVVYLIGAGGQKRRWVFSLETGTWKGTDESDKTIGAQFTKTGNPYFSEAELSASEPFMPSEERGYWEYGKSRPGVKIEGDGIYVYRRPLPAAATQEEDDAELQRQGKAPAYEYKFSVHHVTPDVEMFSRVMWNLRVENPTRTPVKFSVYDTTFDRAADVMVVLFRLNGIVRANLLLGPDKGLLWADTKLDLTADEISRLTKARVEGGPDENSLRLILEIKDAPTLTFAFREGKWVKWA